jgi:2-polyprenyl-3-methyl-5-hydroxy-6-metoxy-1,4-benzoquinol methylase
MSKLHQNNTLRTQSGQLLDLSGESCACPVCGATKKGQVRYSFPPFDIVNCGQCHTLHLSPVPTPKLLAEIYNNNYYQDENLQHGYLDYAAEPERIGRTYRRRLQYLKPFLCNLTDPKVLEIGAALGFGLPVARELFGPNILACDISQEAVTACQKLGFKTKLTDAYATCPDIEPNSLDIVYAFDVVEHIPDFRKFVNWLDLVLKPGGLFFVTTPDMNHVLNKILGSRSPSIKIPQHIIYFTTNTLIAALQPSLKHRAQAWDYQYVGLSMLLSRIAHVMHIPLLTGNFGPSMLVPNGMQMCVFQKEGFR